MRRAKDTIVLTKLNKKEKLKMIKKKKNPENMQDTKTGCKFLFECVKITANNITYNLKLKEHNWKAIQQADDKGI